MRGKELDTLIEHELQLMLVEGFDKSPISAKALHIRLRAKGIVNGGLSTLSSLERDLLKDALAVVRRFRALLQQRLRLDVL